MSDKIDLLDHGFIRLCDHMGDDLSVSRSARISYNAEWRAGEDEGSDKRLINYLWKNKHTTPFESVQFTFEVKAPIFVFRQWHRHRTWCLSGESMISFEKPDRSRKGMRTAQKMRLDELYRKWNDNPPVKRKDKQKRSLRDWNRDRIRNMLLRTYDELTKEFTIGHICDIVQSGVKQVIELELEDGKKIKCSKDHLLLTDDGWKTLENAVGLVVHGNTAGMTKQCNVLTNGYEDTHTPWNKGVTGYKTKLVVTEEHKSKIRAARSGENSNWWKGGISSDRAKIAGWTSRMAPDVHKKFNYTCQAPECGKRGGRLHAHHVKSVVDHPEHAYDFNNLITYCQKCHMIEHGKTGEMRRAKGVTLRAMATKVVSVRIIGEEMTYDISVDGPNHNFVANGLIVHNSYNELSARYKELPEEFYVPSIYQMRTQSATNKQGSGEALDEATARVCQLAIADQCTSSFDVYRSLLLAGVARELARSVLPVNTYSHMFASVNLLNLFRFLTLRCNSHAQHEIKVYADAMKELIKPIVPVCVAAWENSQ